MATVTYREHRPAPALRRHVAAYWSLGEGGSARSHRVLPDGCVDLLVRIGASAVSTSVVGTMTSAILAPPDAGTRFVGVRFLPGEAFALLDVRADALTDLEADPHEAGLLRGGTDELEERISTAGEPLAATLDRWLVERVRAARPPDHRVRRAVDRIERAAGRVRTAELAIEIGVSERQLERAFAERVGVGPKALAKIARLQAMLPRLDRLAVGAGSLADVAAASGYADQSHLVREVRALCGITPSALSRERAGGAPLPSAER